ncbi:hypothetical protein [Amycolatopsis sp. NPDC001319]|uniref:hypothetical protein n=1 Tax=unclassified Amycolatopsis TaxID=2618356 RepID=UPI00369A48E2
MVEKPPLFSAVCRALVRAGLPLVELSDVDLFEVIAATAEWVGPEAGPEVDPRPVAEELENRLSGGWFAESTPSEAQAHFSVAPEPPRVALVRPEPGSTRVFDDKPRGAWWTSSRLPDGTSCWSRSESLVGTPETRAAGEVPPRREHWVTVDLTAARIHRIERAADFAVLLAEYPLGGSGFPRVDWLAVAEDFDAVHLSARGLVYTQDVPIATDRGTSALRGWNCESTAWLTEPRLR